MTLYGEYTAEARDFILYGTFCIKYIYILLYLRATCPCPLGHIYRTTPLWLIDILGPLRVFLPYRNRVLIQIHPLTILVLPLLLLAYISTFPVPNHLNADFNLYRVRTHTESVFGGR